MDQAGGHRVIGQEAGQGGGGPASITRTTLCTHKGVLHCVPIKGVLHCVPIEVYYTVCPPRCTTLCAHQDVI